MRRIPLLIYKANVGRPSKSSAKLPTISKVDTRKESGCDALKGLRIKSDTRVGFQFKGGSDGFGGC